MALPNPGFAFLHWSEAGSIVSETPTYQFTADVNRALVANFIQTFTLTTAAAPAAGGSISPGGIFNSGSILTVTAVPNPGYQFLNWTENGLVVSAAPAYTFPILANRALTANFTPIAYLISTTASPASGGTTQGGGTFNSGDNVTVGATPAEGYTFVNWTENGTIVHTSPNYTFQAIGDRTLVANFIQVPQAISLERLIVHSPLRSATAVGLIKLSAPAPRRGIRVQLSSSNPAVLKTPNFVFIPGGRNAGYFHVHAAKVNVATSATVTARLGNSEQSVTVQILPRKR